MSIKDKMTDELNVQDRGKKSLMGLYIMLGILIVVIVVMMTSYFRYSADIANNKTTVEEIIEPEPTVVTEYVEKEKLIEVEVEKKITPEIIQDGLREMGVLITEEYYFTQVENYTSTKTYLKFITSESSFVYSYDGVVTAGIDFSEIKVAKDDNRKQICIALPKAEIQNVDIDFESFQVYSEKEGIWNKIKISDYNESLVEFEKNAKSKAVEKGILERADEGAQNIISNFISGLVDTDGYEIEFVQK